MLTIYSHKSQKFLFKIFSFLANAEEEMGYVIRH